MKWTMYPLIGGNGTGQTANGCGRIHHEQSTGRLKRANAMQSLPVQSGEEPAQVLVSLEEDPTEPARSPGRLSGRVPQQTSSTTTRPRSSPGGRRRPKGRGLGDPTRCSANAGCGGCWNSRVCAREDQCPPAAESRVWAGLAAARPWPTASAGCTEAHAPV